jgi:hypothetical protein
MFESLIGFGRYPILREGERFGKIKIENFVFN